MNEIEKPNLIEVLLYSEKVAPQIFKNIKEKCLTTFHMPLNVATMKPMEAEKQWLLNFPFDTFAIVEPFITPGHFIGPDCLDVHGFEECICRQDESGRITILSKFRYTIGPNAGRIIYSPTSERQDEYSKNPGIYCELYHRFYKALYSRQNRFIEESVSRQVRRANKYPANYREYIVIPKEDVRYASAIHAATIVKRMKELHAVRGHLRTNWKTGQKNILVKPHTRGQGEALQAKEYIVE